MKPCGNTARVCVEGKKASDEKLKNQRIKLIVFTNLHTVAAQVMIVPCMNRKQFFAYS